MRRAAAGAFLLLSLAAPLPAPALPDPPPAPPAPADVVPVPHPGPAGDRQGAALASLWRAEAAYRGGRTDDAMSLFLDLAYNSPDDERKGFVWMRIGELLLGRGDLTEALSAADRAVRLLRARYLVLQAMDLKFRIYERTQRRADARQVAAYLLEQKYIHADPASLHLAIARADAEEGRLSKALGHFDRAIAAARFPEEAGRLRSERDAFVDGASDPAVLREAAEAEMDLSVKSHLYLVLGRVAIRRGFEGMGAFALEQAARAGGPRGQEAAEQLLRLEKILAGRPRIMGLVPLSGRLAEAGFAVLVGAEVALRQARGAEPEAVAPVLRWADTGGEPERARRIFTESSSDRTVVGYLGPLTGEEGRSVGMAFGPASPPVLYLGQKLIPEKPFLYSFGLTPHQEVQAVLSRLAAAGRTDLILFFPENGYGRGFAEAVAAVARDTGTRVVKTVSYSPDLRDFTRLIRKTVGDAAFSRYARSREKGKGITGSKGAIVIADRWDKVFQVASQLRFYNVYLPLAGFSGWYDPELVRKAGDAVSGALLSVDYADSVPDPQGERFRRDMSGATRRPPSRFEAMGYDGALLLRSAYDPQRARDARSAGDSVREGLLRLKTLRGVTGLFQIGSSGEMRRRVILLRVEQGNFVPVPDV